MIDIKNVTKKFEDREVLKNININVKRGSIFGLIGPNGAGKTTLIKCIMGIYKTDGGIIKVNGSEVYDNENIKRIIGYVADENNYFSGFSVKDMLDFYGLSYGKFSIKRFNELNDVFQISLKKNVRRLSKGMKTRLAIMLNLSIMPEVIVLDEPTSGLDPIAKRQVLSILMDDAAERKTTMFISTHNLTDLEKVCDSIAIINNGEIKYTNTLEEMKKNIRKFQVAFRDAPPDDLKSWKEVLNVEKYGRVYNIITSSCAEEVMDKLKKYEIMFIEEVDLSLEDMFIYTMRSEKNEIKDI